MPRRMWFEIINTVTGGAIVRAPGPPLGNATYEQRVHWGAIIATRNEVYRYKGTSRRIIDNYVRMCEEYCYKWAPTDSELDSDEEGISHGTAGGGH